MRPRSDAEAVRGLRRDPEAIAVLYDRHVGRLVAALAAVGGDRELAFDIAQETFARLPEHGRRVRVADDGTAWPWLWTVGRNLLRDQQRRSATDARARRRLGISVAPYEEHAVDELISRVDAEQLRAELAGSSRAGGQALRARVSRGLRALRVRLSGGRP
jgi:RNA polymerase sigma-70 factor (ECF subfamily)